VTEPRRFPLPWRVEETDACFIVRDANGHALAYVYFEEEPGRRQGRARHGRPAGETIFPVDGPAARKHRFI
jgi:hypothetical protein